MFQDKRIGGILLLGGSGTRFGGKIPKQFLPLGDKKIFEHSLETFLSAQLFDEIILVCHPDWLFSCQDAKVVAGGPTRQNSCYIGLQSFDSPPDIVLIHDAARPFVSEKIILENIEKTILYGAVDTCIPCTDTLVYAPDFKHISQIPPRTHYQRGQTPQTFRYDWILKAHKAALAKGIFDATDDCQLFLELGQSVHIVQGSERNFKITTEIDLKLAQFFT